MKIDENYLGEVGEWEVIDLNSEESNKSLRMFFLNLAMIKPVRNLKSKQ